MNKGLGIDKGVTVAALTAAYNKVGSMSAYKTSLTTANNTDLAAYIASRFATAAAPPAPVAFQPAPLQARTLTSWQYRGAIGDILGAEARAAVTPPTDIRINGLATVASSTVALSPKVITAYETNAYAAVQAAMANAKAQLIPCTPTSPTDDACLTTVLNRVGGKAFRRILSAEELTTWKRVAQSAATV